MVLCDPVMEWCCVTLGRGMVLCEFGAILHKMLRLYRLWYNAKCRSHEKPQVNGPTNESPLFSFLSSCQTDHSLHGRCPLRTTAGACVPEPCRPFVTVLLIQWLRVCGFQVQDTLSV